MLLLPDAECIVLPIDTITSSVPPELALPVRLSSLKTAIVSFGVETALTLFRQQFNLIPRWKTISVETILGYDDIRLCAHRKNLPWSVGRRTARPLAG